MAEGSPLNCFSPFFSWACWCHTSSLVSAEAKGRSLAPLRYGPRGVVMMDTECSASSARNIVAVSWSSLVTQDV